MWNLIRLIPTFFLVCLPACRVFADEQDVQIGPGFSAKLVMPEVDTNRAVLLLHGFNGQQDEVGNLYLELSEALAEVGIASLRFNFDGEGPQSDFVVTMTYDSRIAQSEQAYSYLRRQYPNGLIGVQGFSLGGLTAMAVAGDHPDWFESMVVWSAAESMSFAESPEYAPAAMEAVRKGSAVVSTWTDSTFTREFVTSFLGVTVLNKLPHYPGAFLSVRGTRDFLPSRDSAWLELLPTDDKAFLLIGGADHIYGVLENPKPGYSERAIKASVDWFSRTLQPSRD